MTYRRRIRLEVALDVDDAHVPSVVEVYPTADWQERETWDMFGVVFDGHPALTRILMPDDWDGHPQRKDYPLGGIPVEYKGAEIPPPDERRAYSSDPYRPATTTHARRKSASPPRARVYTVTGGDWDTLARRAEHDDRIVVNMGPQHPSTHGVLRLVLELEGETVTQARSVIGYLHTGIEKNCEYRTWTQGVTFVTRMDYLVAAVQRDRATAWPSRSCSASRLRARAQVDPGAADGAQPDRLAPGGARHRRHGARRAHRHDGRLPRARGSLLHLLELLTGLRMNMAFIRPGGVAQDLPGRLIEHDHTRSSSDHARRGCRTTTSCCPGSRSGGPHGGRRLPAAGRLPARSASPARSCAPPGLPWDLRKIEPYCGYEDVRLRGADGHRRRLLRPLPAAGRGDAGVAEDHRAGRQAARWSPAR